jgi:hypothetical protein
MHICQFSVNIWVAIPCFIRMSQTLPQHFSFITFLLVVLDTPLMSLILQDVLKSTAQILYETL